MYSSCAREQRRPRILRPGRLAQACRERGKIASQRREPRHVAVHVGGVGEGVIRQFYK